MISVFDLFKIGVGPSSSHTVGPMVAGRLFAQKLSAVALPARVQRIACELYGSLALTGIGHQTDRAVLIGLMGEQPDTVDPSSIERRCRDVHASSRLKWLGLHDIEFSPATDLIFHRDQFLTKHPNGMRFTAWDIDGQIVFSNEYFSVGGGFVIEADEAEAAEHHLSSSNRTHAPLESPFEFCNAVELLALCKQHRMSIAELVHENERAERSDEEIASGLDRIWDVMSASIHNGYTTRGVLPGGLNVRRRAWEMYGKLTSCSLTRRNPDALDRMDWVAMFALAVNEENAAGGRVVTAPTNGAAGVIPAVIGYYEKFMDNADRAGIHTFLKTAAAIGMLFKRNASLSAAEMGCQGEVGVACSMAAGGLAAVMGGTPDQIENAAEIGMEHNLGLTCDPVAGLVQVPCIERNTMGAVKAINAARLAVLYGDGQHSISLDHVIETMRQTGVDMQAKYKETSLGGLAVNMTNC